LDKTDKSAHKISYPGYGYVRLGRPTRNGTFLIPSDTTLFEGDAKGNVLWKANGAQWGHIWEALLMKDGSTIVCTAFGSSCDVLDPTTHMVKFRFGSKAGTYAFAAGGAQCANAAGCPALSSAIVKPNFFSEFEILPNGNLVVPNWQGHGGNNGASGIQVLEFDPTGNVVWYYKQDPMLFSSIQGAMVLDGKDPQYLHVEETADSTWQPVK
jgi:hypothetical protein